MSLTRVTITGADDGIAPAELAALSREFPFVEWGVLFSINRQGSRRYPSYAWIGRLLALRGSAHIRLSAHLCGQLARETALGGITHGIQAEFGRIQLNGYESLGWPFVDAIRATEAEFILQVREESALKAAAVDARRIDRGRGSILYDISGGKGVEIAFFPPPPAGVCMGYAGGIKPATVAEVPGALRSMSANYWIDMESGVRSADDRFDLGLVRQALVNVQPYVGSEATF
jgi:hypothetical protein